MALLDDLVVTNCENLLIKFETESTDSVTSTSPKAGQHKSKTVDESKPEKLELKHFVDQSLAQDYLCKICQFIVVDPMEHKTGQKFTCPSLFCSQCVQSWFKSGKVYCPSPGCQTTGFDESILREIGARDAIRLSGLILNCPFSCGLKCALSEYTSQDHRNLCPANPANLCKVCKSAKVNHAGVHDCRIVINELRQKIESLNSKVFKLNGIINQLRNQVNTSKNAQMKLKEKTKESNDIIKKSNEKKGKSDEEPEKKVQKGQQSSADKQSVVSEESKSVHVNGQSKDPSKSTLTFYSNNYLPKSGSSGVNLVFHYGEKKINFDYVQSTYSIRTLRSLITDTLGHDPGSMLFIQHRLLNDKDIVKDCGFRLGVNFITILPMDTPNYGEPGYRLSVFLPRTGTTSTDESKPNNLVNFVSNNLNNKRESVASSKLEFTFFLNESYSFTCNLLKPHMTIEEMRYIVTSRTGNSQFKLLYMKHLELEDSAIVSQYNFPHGTTDIVLIDSAVKSKFGIYGPPACHFNRFLTNKSSGIKLGQSGKSTSLASLV